MSRAQFPWRVVASAASVYLISAAGCSGEPAPHPVAGTLDVSTPATTSTSEAGAELTLSVALSQRPSADVVVPVASDDASEAVASPATLTFTKDDWSAPQTVTVRGVDDALFDGSQTFHVAFGPASSEDLRFEGASATSVPLLNVDDEVAGIALGAPSGPTSESGGTATFTVVLTGKPTANVIVTLSNSDPGEGTVLASSLTFTVTNWNAPRTIMVRGVDDSLTDGSQTFDVSVATITSNDPHYATLSLPPPVTFTNTDDDTPGVTLSAASRHTTEAGATATFTAALRAMPSADVTLHFATDDPSEGTTSVTALTFTPLNWNAAQMVTVTGEDDALADGNQPYHVAFGATTSADPAYAALAPPASVALTNDDDDSAGISVSAAMGSPNESGTSATFTVVLASQPTAAITLHLDTSDATEGTPDVTALVFDGTTWNVPQTVTVTGQDDALMDGDQPFSIVFSAQTGGDAEYVALAPPTSIPFVNIDNETPGFAITSPSGHTHEVGSPATFSVALRVAPTSSVTIQFDTDDPSEGSPSVTMLTFTPADWSTPKPVTVTGADDSVADGNQPYAIAFSSIASTDPAYSGLPLPADVALVNDDDDSASVVVVVASSDTSETSGTASFSVALGSQPTADVTVHFDTTNGAEGTPSVTSLVFTSVDWNVPQSVTVTGVNDLVVDGNAAYAIAFSACTGADATYVALAPPGNVALVNADDDYTTYRIKSTYVEGGTDYYLANLPGYFHTVIARLVEPALSTNDFVWVLRPGLADPSDPVLVTLEPFSYPGRAMRIDSAMPTRYPPCGEASPYGWALCNVPVSEQAYLGWTDSFAAGATYASDATFRRVAALNGNGAMLSFRWYGGSTRYLRHNYYNVKALPMTGTAQDNLDASFSLEAFGQVVH